MSGGREMVCPETGGWCSYRVRQEGPLLADCGSVWLYSTTWSIFELDIMTEFKHPHSDWNTLRCIHACDGPLINDHMHDQAVTVSPLMHISIQYICKFIQKKVHLTSSLIPSVKQEPKKIFKGECWCKKFGWRKVWLWGRLRQDTLERLHLSVGLIWALQPSLGYAAMELHHCVRRMHGWMFTLTFTR